VDIRSRVRGVIFDLDGTLIDSEPVYHESDIAFFKSKGISLSREEQLSFIGIGAESVIEKLRSRGLEGDTETIVAEKDSVFLELSRGRTRVFPRVRELVRYLHVAGIPMAVATSSRRRVLEVMLDESKLRPFFTVTVSSDDVEEPKPSPEVFLQVARRLELDPAQCLVVEDSRYGVTAAKAAGMRVVALPHEGVGADFSAADLLFSGADAIDPAEVIRSFGLGIPPDELDSERIARFGSLVYAVDKQTGRKMPWRTTDDPYRILVSEMMLHQTQVARVERCYAPFLDAFPTLQALAAASRDSVVRKWQGLGYNRRARYLHDCARAIVGRHGGRMPEATEDLVRLPGVGPYTAAAIQAFAFNMPVVMIETNIRRLFIYFFRPAAESIADRELVPLIQAAVDRSDTRRWYYALMDYGSYLGSVLPNPNRRSAHYTRQSSFAGSVREVRGQVIRALSQRGSLSMRELERAIGPTDDRLASALQALETERLIVRDRDTISLAR
jgi:A/G-specific adenine glycosylase